MCNGLCDGWRTAVLAELCTADYVGDKAAEEWANWDALGFLQGMGVIPELSQARGGAAE